MALDAVAGKEALAKLIEEFLAGWHFGEFRFYSFEDDKLFAPSYLRHVNKILDSWPRIRSYYYFKEVLIRIYSLTSQPSTGKFPPPHLDTHVVESISSNEQSQNHH